MEYFAVLRAGPFPLRPSIELGSGIVLHGLRLE
jgi:hypothetical protein